jgi:hypothetical protein
VAPPVNHDSELAHWKAIADARHAAYLKEQADLAAERQRVIDEEVRELNAHVKSRLEKIALYADINGRERVKMEQLRLQQRAEDRVRRREERFQRYLEKEREHMVFEDARSFKVQYVLFSSVIALYLVPASVLVGSWLILICCFVILSFVYLED